MLISTDRAVLIMGFLLLIANPILSSQPLQTNQGLVWGFTESQRFYFHTLDYRNMNGDVMETEEEFYEQAPSPRPTIKDSIGEGMAIPFAAFTLHMMNNTQIGTDDFAAVPLGNWSLLSVKTLLRFANEGSSVEIINTTETWGFFISDNFEGGFSYIYSKDDGVITQRTYEYTARDLSFTRTTNMTRVAKDQYFPELALVVSSGLIIVVIVVLHKRHSHGN